LTVVKYSEGQERVPAGSPEGGEFAGGPMSADEATSRLGDTFPGIKTYLDKMDPTLRGRAVRQLEKLGKAYPEVHLSGIGTQPSNTRGMGRNTAYVPLYGSTMHLNEAQFRSASKMAMIDTTKADYEKQYGRPWTVTVKGEPEDCITHEFGHLVDGQLLSMVGGGPKMPIISDYARKSGSAYTEGFAEAFVQAANGMDTPAARYVDERVAQARAWRSRIAKYSEDQARDESGRWTSDGEGSYIGVRADELPVGTRMVYGDTPPAGIPISFDREHPGITLRGDKTIDWRDPRIPDTVYHMTTNLPEVQKDGYLLAGGKGGLGGDAHDRIVSMTLDHGIAQQLVDDVKLNAAAWQSKDPVAVYTAQADKEGWGDKWRASWPFKDGKPVEGIGYGAGDWSSAYFPIRQSTTGARDPQFWGDSGKYVDPEKVGVVAIPKDNLNNGALLVNFDLDRPVPWTLQEVRSYGDVPLKGATFTKAAVPALYKLLKYSEDQERDDHGRWTSGGGAGDAVPVDLGDRTVYRQPGGMLTRWPDLRTAMKEYSAAHPGTDVSGMALAKTEEGVVTLDQLDKLQTLFPAVPVRAIGVAAMSDTLWARYLPSGQPEGNQIQLNMTYYGDLPNADESGLWHPSAGFHPSGCDNPQGVVTHEFGHAVDAYLHNAPGVELRTEGWDALTHDQKVARNEIMDGPLWGANISHTASGYGKTNFAENFAEIFSAAYTPGVQTPEVGGFKADMAKCLPLLKEPMAISMPKLLAQVDAANKAATVTKVSGLAFADRARAILRNGLAAAYVVGRKTVPVVPPAPAPRTVAPGLIPDEGNYDEHDWYDELDDDGQQVVNESSDGVDERLLSLGALLLGGAVSAAMLDAWMGTYAASLNPAYEEGFQAGVADQGTIMQVTWNAEDDPATCEDCQMLDGMTWVGAEIDGAMPHPGDSRFGGRTACGPACRCSLSYQMVPTDDATYSWGGYDNVEEMSTADLLKVWAITSQSDIADMPTGHLLTLRSILAKYSEGQERDEDGRFAGGGAVTVPIKVVPEVPGAVARYESGHVVLSQSTLDEMNTIGFQRQYWLGYRADGSVFSTSGMSDKPADFVRGWGGDTHDFAHEVGHGFEDQFDLTDPAKQQGLGSFNEDTMKWVSPGPDLRGNGTYPPSSFKNPSEAAAGAFADYVQVPDRMDPGVKSWVEDRLAETPKWNGVVAALRETPDPREWVSRGAITGKITKRDVSDEARDEHGQWTAGGFPSTDEQMRGMMLDVRTAHGGGGVSRTLDGKPITPDTRLVVFHGTEPATARGMNENGVVAADKPWSLARERYEEGEASTYAPGAGIGEGLYVAANPNDASGYGHSMVAVTVRAGDLQLPPEANVLPGDHLTQVLEALSFGDIGASVDGDIPADRIRLVEPARGRNMIPDGTVAELKKYSEDQARVPAGEPGALATLNR
jgi:hypothetical protein